MESRRAFFEQQLLLIEDIRKQGYSALLSFMLNLKDTIIDNLYDDVMEVEHDETNFKSDAHAQALYPGDAPTNFQPYKSTQDGNCLYNSVSLLLTGKEDLASELRVKTSAELVENFSYYVKGNFLPKSVIQMIGGRDIGMKKALEKTLIHLFSVQSVDHHKGNIEETLQNFIVESCSDGQWSSLLHVSALTNVLSRDIISIYPYTNARMRPLMNLHLRPEYHLFGEKEPLHIMWTGKKESYGIDINHIVPCAKVCSIFVVTSCLNEQKHTIQYNAIQ